MNNKLRMAVIGCLVIGLLLPSCGPGQVLGPTIAPTYTGDWWIGFTYTYNGNEKTRGDTDFTGVIPIKIINENQVEIGDATGTLTGPSLFLFGCYIELKVVDVPINFNPGVYSPLAFFKVEIQGDPWDLMQEKTSNCGGVIDTTTTTLRDGGIWGEFQKTTIEVALEEMVYICKFYFPPVDGHRLSISSGDSSISCILHKGLYIK
jgi:hypothetical protein